MKKVLIYGIILFIVASLVLAIQYGDILNQDQLNAINVDNHDLNCTLINVTKGIEFINSTYECDDMQVINSSAYKYMKKNHTIQFHRPLYDLCKKENNDNITLCKQEAIKIRDEKLAEQIKKIKNEIKYYQDSPEQELTEEDFKVI